MAAQKIWQPDGNAIVWDVKEGQCHQDDYEMSGLFCDMIIGYGVSGNGMLLLDRSFYFPTLRTIPNDTHATLEIRPMPEMIPALLQNGQPLPEYPIRFRLDGVLTVESRTADGIWIRRQFFPAAESRCAVETVTVVADRAAVLTLSQGEDRVLGSKLGTKGVYVSRVRHTAQERICLLAGDSYTYSVFYSADIGAQASPVPDCRQALQQRRSRIEALCDRSLVLDTGIPELDAMVRFAKLRAGESIFQTLTGKYHSPGGRTYYAAVWCNDQVEYAGPHFAMTADAVAIEASLNAYRAYIPFMTSDYRPIPSSVIAEGLDIWNGAGDRGDAAMYLYGASLFALYLGDESIARELYGPVRWCAEYCESRKTPEGVIGSDTDELERRIPTDGYANLSTSCLCCGGLRMAARLADALADPETAAIYRARADALEQAIEDYYGATLHGFDTYRYSKGFDTLRSWICLPLCAGITNRADATVDAMLSEYLWTEEGMLSCELSEDNRNGTIWDRSTLYGFKAVFLSGQGDRIMEPLRCYCRKRLLCDRVPYAVEAYPEGGKRQLSGESALLIRAITEGLLAIQPESLKSFSFVPRLPEAMPHIDLSELYIAGHNWHIRVEREHWWIKKDGEMAASGKTDGKRTTVK